MSPTAIQNRSWLVCLPSSSVLDEERERESGGEESSLEGGTYPMTCSTRTFFKYFANRQDHSSSHLLFSPLCIAPLFLQPPPLPQLTIKFLQRVLV